MKHNDDLLKELMPLSKVKIPLDNFEDRVMGHIKMIEAKKVDIHKKKLYSIIFFLGCLVFGFILIQWFTNIIIASSIDNGFKQQIRLSSQIIYVALIVLFSNRIFALIKAKRFLAGTHKISQAQTSL